MSLHSTSNRKRRARSKAMQKWKNGLQMNNLLEPTESECLVFCTGFKLGWHNRMVLPKNPKRKSEIIKSSINRLLRQA